MSIKFIGTGSGKTSLKRFHSSLIIEENDFRCLVDAGDGVSKALLNQGLDFHYIDALVITHFHADHFAGIISLYTQMILTQRSKPLKVIAHSLQIKDIKRFLEYGNIFVDHLDFETKFIGIPFNDPVLINNGFQLELEQNNHFRKKYDTESDQSFLSSSLSFYMSNKNVFYSSDISEYEDLASVLEKNWDFFICESTHISKEEIKNLIKEVKCSSICFTHIDDSDEDSLLEIKKEMELASNKNVIIAYDGLEIE